MDEGNNFKRILAQLLSFLRKPLTYHVGRSLFIQNDRRTSPLPLCEMNLYSISTFMLIINKFLHYKYGKSSDSMDSNSKVPGLELFENHTKLSKFCGLMHLPPKPLFNKFAKLRVKHSSIVDSKPLSQSCGRNSNVASAVRAIWA